jgi:hypothetical protein
VKLENQVLFSSFIGIVIAQILNYFDHSRHADAGVILGGLLGPLYLIAQRLDRLK